MGKQAFYMVDRGKTLRQGDTLRLGRAGDRHARHWFPDGLSRHGRDFVLDKDADAEGIRIEILLELLRRAHHPHKPSRMQAFFAVGSLEEARRFRREKRQTGAPILQLNAKSGHRGDMRWLRWRNTMLRNLDWADRYWNGAPTTTPRWEHLLLPPAKVARRVDAKA